MVMPPNIGTNEFERILRDLERRVSDLERQTPEIHNFNFSGAWNTAAPGPTDGVAFVVRTSGWMRGFATATGWTNSAATGIQVDLYIDQVAHWSMAMPPNLAAGEHMSLSVAQFGVFLKAGTHYFYFRDILGESDSNDRGSFYGVITPI